MRHDRRTMPPGLAAVDVALLVAIAGLLTAFAVPRFTLAMERAAAARAFAYLATVHAAQERYHARTGHYAGTPGALNLSLPRPPHFTSTGLEIAAPGPGRRAWCQTLARVDGPPDYGPYTVVFDQQGFNRARSTILRHPALLPARARPRP